MGADEMGQESSSTIVMVPRDTFSSAAESLASVCEHREGARVLCVDAGSPPRVKRELEEVASARDVALIRVDRYLSPNQARNLAMKHVTTTFAVFVDNDVRASPGWLTSLARCAVETDAAVVTPTTLINERGHTVVHHLGGYAHVAEEDGARVFVTGQWGRDGDADHDGSQRTMTEEGEFHCMLVASRWFREVGGLDEGLLSMFENSDFCLRVRDAGGTVWVEPASVISYGRPRFIARHDRQFYILRWSDHWNESSARCLQAQWRLDVDPYQASLRWAVERRRYGYRPFITPFNRIGRFGRPVVDLVDRLAQRAAVARWNRSLGSDLAPHFSHVASWQAS